MTVAPITLRKKATQLGEFCEQQVQEWKVTCEDAKRDETCLVMIKNELISCNYLPHAPTVGDMKNYMSYAQKNSQGNTFNNDEFQTIEMSGLYFSFQDSMTIIKNICDSLIKQGVQKQVILNVFS